MEICYVININSKTYYKYRNKKNPDYLIIKEIFDYYKSTYEYRMIVYDLLQEYGLIMNRKKVLR